MNITDKIEEYLSIKKQCAEWSKKQKEYKETLSTLESYIQDYMLENNVNSINTTNGEVILYDRKINQSMKKETMIEKLTSELKDAKIAENLVGKILSNKVFTTEPKIKPRLKKV